MENSNKKYYSIADICEILGFSYGKINKLIRDKQIPAYKIGVGYRVYKKDFEDYMDRQKVIKSKKKSVKTIYRKRPIYDNEFGITLIGQ